MGAPRGLYIVPFTHDPVISNRSTSPEPTHEKENAFSWKNKTTKTGFVVEIITLVWICIHLNISRYFFLVVVFFAFFAGAFFVAMDVSPPFDEEYCYVE